MKHSLPELPYPLDALEPHMSRETLEYNHGKHHATNVDKLNGLIGHSEFADMSLRRIVERSEDAIFNDVAQARNQAFFRNCLTPTADGAPPGDLAQAVERDFGGAGGLRECFAQAFAMLFGSGRIWPVRDAGGNLAIRALTEAANSVTDGQTPLLTCDARERAHYIDYRNAKADYFENFRRLIDWEFVARKYQRTQPFSA